jgi:hypothetical protein
MEVIIVHKEPPSWAPACSKYILVVLKFVGSGFDDADAADKSSMADVLRVLAPEWAYLSSQ